MTMMNKKYNKGICSETQNRISLIFASFIVESALTGSLVLWMQVIPGVP